MEQFTQFIMHHMALFGALVMIVILIYVNEWLTQKRSGKALSPQGLVEKINHDDAVVLDIRDEAAFSAGHIINAIRVTEQNLKMNKYKDKPVVVVCQKGLTAKAFAAKLTAEGLTVMTLEGGITAWKAAGLPLVKGNK